MATTTQRTSQSADSNYRAGTIVLHILHDSRPFREAVVKKKKMSVETRPPFKATDAPKKVSAFIISAGGRQ